MQKQNKFTPGPWVIETYHGSMFKICKPDFKIGDEVCHRLESDARLIAAAPEMFEALESVVKAIASDYEDQKTESQLSNQYHDLMKLIKKAKGE